MRQFVAGGPDATASTSQILGSHVESMSPMVSVLYRNAPEISCSACRSLSVICRLPGVGHQRYGPSWNKCGRRRGHRRDPRAAETVVPVRLEHVAEICLGACDCAQQIHLPEPVDERVDANPDAKKVSSMLYYGWKNKLKTGMYYLRSQSKSKASQWGVDSNEVCETCSS